jgi:hypothetical protein
MAADDNNMCDWVADCNGEGQELAVRNSGDSEAVMMAAAAEEGVSGQRQQRRTTKVADNNGMQDWAEDYEVDGQDRRREMAETWSGDDSCGGGRWRRWTTMAADDNNGDGGR